MTFVPLNNANQPTTFRLQDNLSSMLCISNCICKQIHISFEHCLWNTLHVQLPLHLLKLPNFKVLSFITLTIFNIGWQYLFSTIYGFLFWIVSSTFLYVFLHNIGKIFKVDNVCISKFGFQRYKYKYWR